MGKNKNCFTENSDFKDNFDYLIEFLKGQKLSLLHSMNSEHHGFKTTFKYVYKNRLCLHIIKWKKCKITKKR